jgi:2-oxoglutarate ferredoxin oxidoreductase subunit gamma
MMEREVIFTGIGGQGIQLMARVLAQAVAADGRHVMLFGVYGGAMRGSASESTLVIGAGAIQAPPIVPRCWSVVAMHPQGLVTVARKLRPDGVLCVNETLVPDPPRAGRTCLAIPATRMAEQAGNLMGAAMILLGFFVARTELVAVDALVSAMRAALPAHRARLADANAALLRLGADYGNGRSAPTFSG